MDAQLLLARNTSPAQPFPLRKAETVIGRQTGCQIRVPSGSVSRRHCRVLIEDDLAWVDDLGSANGTLVNGRRIKGRQVLRPGDWLQTGVAKFLIVYALTPQAIAKLLTLAPTPMAPPKEEALPEIDVQVMDDDIGMREEPPRRLESDELLPMDDQFEDESLSEQAQEEKTVSFPPPKLNPPSKKKKKKDAEQESPAAPSLQEFDVANILKMRRKTMLGKDGAADLNDLGE